MKKLFWMIIAVAVAAVSCDKEVPTNEDVNPVEGNEVVTGDNDWSGYDADKYLVSFTGTIEETKTTIDYTTGVTTWEAGDKVLVYVAESGESGQYEYKTDGKFYPVDTDNLVPTEVGQTVYVYYPYSAELTPSGASASLTIPAAAERLVKAPMAGVVTAQSGVEPTIAFKNLGAVLHLTLKGSDTLTAVELSNTNLALSGPATISWTGGIPALSVTGDARSVTAEGSVDLTAEGVEYSFLLPPSATAMEGMTLKFIYGKTVGEVNYAPYQTKSRTSALTCERNHSYGLTFNLGFFSGGDGSEDNPYQIATEEDFENLAAYILDETADGPAGFIADNGTFFGSAGAHYLQTANLDFEGVDLTPIGTSDKPFCGIYDGGEKTMSNIVIDVHNTSAQFTGPFGYVEQGEIRKVNISSAEIAGDASVGGIAGGIMNATVTDCTVIQSVIQGDAANVGGIVGRTYGGTISNCSITGVTVSEYETAAGNNYGGIVGYGNNNNVLTIENCHVDATSSIHNNNNKGQVGGIIGGCGIPNAADFTVTGCTNAATISGGTGGSVGGIIGTMANGVVSNCSNIGSITSGGNLAGGIAGRVTGGGELYACWSDATVTAIGSQAGGIAGFLQWGVINCCHAKGSVSGTNYIAGIVGRVLSGTENSTTHRVLVHQCLAQADVTSSTGANSSSGGVIGILQAYKYTGDDGDTMEYAMVTHCVGWKASVKNTATDKCERFGAFIGYVATNKSNLATNNRCFVENCYTALEDGDLTWSTSTVSRTGGFIGWINRGSLKNCFYQISDNTQDATTSTNNKWISNLTRFDNDFSSNLMTKLEVRTTAMNVANGSGKTYVGSDWTLVGKNGETLAFPLPQDLVDLGTEFYQ